MWRVIWFFLGVSRLSITGASPEWCMQRLAKARIAFHFCAKPDDFTAEVWILRRDEARAAQLVRMGGCDCAVIERGGFSTVFGGLRKRPARFTQDWNPPYTPCLAVGLNSASFTWKARMRSWYASM